MFYQWWFGLVVLLVFLIIAALCVLFYPWIWYDLLQRYEPFTSQMARIANKRPWLWWSLNGVIIVLLLVCIAVAPWYLYPELWYLRIILAMVTGFFGWFETHIYGATQDPDNPPHLIFYQFYIRQFFRLRQLRKGK